MSTHDTMPPQPLFVIYEHGPDCVSALTTAVRKDRRTAHPTIGRKQRAVLVEHTVRTRADAEQRARDLLGDLTLELVGHTPAGALTTLVGDATSTTCGAVPTRDGGFVFFGFAHHPSTKE
ncbi:hypothetical protein [Amycolatopsis sp. CA-230715]|uniref:hypothetical protein n=1 Tax=Amycolatopsis sp. CA-230715 TaxID=2745196 RepID=UPI001C01038E|nr:hypothetical protein [Amycolatopsis sp. CA-230715]QWF81040.1 hypothetical protein HUW46_04465 [Amycolatopsis sp. CA-230715]